MAKKKKSKVKKITELDVLSLEDILVQQLTENFMSEEENITIEDIHNATYKLSFDDILALYSHAYQIGINNHSEDDEDNLSGIKYWIHYA